MPLPKILQDIFAQVLCSLKHLDSSVSIVGEQWHCIVACPTPAELGQASAVNPVAVNPTRLQLPRDLQPLEGPSTQPYVEIHQLTTNQQRIPRPSCLVPRVPVYYDFRISVLFEHSKHLRLLNIKHPIIMSSPTPSADGAAVSAAEHTSDQGLSTHSPVLSVKASVVAATETDPDDKHTDYDGAQVASIKQLQSDMSK